MLKTEEKSSSGIPSFQPLEEINSCNLYTGFSERVKRYQTCEYCSCFVVNVCCVKNGDCAAVGTSSTYHCDDSKKKTLS